jgi:hypothetical protein
MTWHMIRLELARTPDFPDGSAAHAYVLHLPLLADGHIDALEWAADKPQATVRRLWPGEAIETGHVIRRRGGAWALSYRKGADDDEPFWHLDTHAFKPGEYVTITETDGTRLPFRVASCHPSAM